MKPLPSEKYRQARQIASVNGLFFRDNKAATLYAAIEKLGYAWDAHWGTWVRTAQAGHASATG